MDRAILVSALAAGVVALSGSAAAQDEPPAVAPSPAPAASPPPAPAASPPPAPTIALPPALAPPSAPAAEAWPKASDLIDLGALSLTLGVFTGATVLVCSFSIGPGSHREACQGGLGGISLALVAASAPLFVLGTRKQRTTAWILDRATFTATTRGGTLGWATTF
jgi:hypothetical protein